ncbi:hypothetical protein ES288_D12G018200v1 [Gossypium darwinii]|uniref:LMBR1-like membrane protein n=1 Tax=Gossypium darwinii TaxID=34276 RepID=A0A5D2A4J8_GOSDA|nr:hypothetical protein ES288_D12G018200v1 [Gossypium darwinii]
MGMVILTLRYFAGPAVPIYVLLTVGYTWFCSFSIIILVPADIWTTMVDHSSKAISLFWSLTYWSTFLLTCGGILGFAMACSNTFGLVTGAFLLGFGLSEIPKGIWKNADWSTRQKLKEDSSFKPQGGRFGENDMDYDTDEKSMASLRRRLRIARDQYCRYRRKFVSSFRPVRTGKLGPYLDTTEFVWRCILRKQLQKLLAVILGCMSAAILLAEATILPRGVDLSLFSILINSVGRQELVGQITSFIPLMYMCVCTYYSLFKIGMLMFYALTPGQTSSVSLLMICSMVARYAPPISYNFLNLIDLPGKGKTVFEKRMGNIDDAVPFFGKGFNKIYPLIMVVYTFLLVTNFFDRVIKYFGNWKLFKLQIEVDGTDGFDTSGLIILQKERSWLEQGYKVGENIIPLARNFSSTSIDIEPGSNNTMVNKDKSASISRANSAAELEKMGEYKPLKEEVKQETSREALTKKYSGVREQPKNQESNSNSTDKESTSIAVDDGNSESARASLSGGLALKWESMKSGLLSFKTNLEAKNFLPLRQTQESKAPSHVSSSESLDEIFQKLKRSSMDPKDHDDDDEF